jgi:hypothetical protein
MIYRQRHWPTWRGILHCLASAGDKLLKRQRRAKLVHRINCLHLLCALTSFTQKENYLREEVDSGHRFVVSRAPLVVD